MTEEEKNNTPETVQWLLDFLNINSTPGKPDLYRLPYELRNLRRPPRPKDLSKLMPVLFGYRDADTGYEWQNIKKPKKINIHKVEMQLQEIRAKKKLLLQRILPDKKDEEIEKLIKQQEEEIISALNNRDKRSEVIKTLNPAKDLKFDGINTAPTLEDFKQFFLEKGIPPYKGKALLLENGKPLSSLNIKSYNNRPKNNNDHGFYDYYQDNPRIEYTFDKVVSNEHCELSRILSNMVWGTKTYENEDTGCKSLRGYLKRIEGLYLECWKGDEVPAESGRTSWGAPYRGRYDIVSDSKGNKEPFPHYGMIPHALYACIMDFGFNHEESLPRLKQCKYCGTFWIPEKKRGRPRKFCSDVCRERHDDQTREANKEAVKNTRKHQKTKKQKEDYKALVEYLKQKEHPEREAKEIAQDWVYTYGKSFKEYKRTQGAMY